VAKKEESELEKMVHRGKTALPPRLVIYGSHGIGKSSIASQFPKPIFLDTEDGLGTLEVDSIPIKNYQTMKETVGYLVKDKHEWQTIVLDSVDWLSQPVIRDYIEDTHESKDLGYGKDHQLAAQLLQEILQGFDVARRKVGMNIVILSHAIIQRYEDPRSDPYDRYVPDLQRRSMMPLMEWCDALGFAAYDIHIRKSDKGFNKESSRGISSGERYLHFNETPAYMAKNRYAISESILLDYDALVDILPIHNAN
tara:strand:- start:174 stop:932 length:759 start_codon:yes stop_codon:yes gene_type:complete